MSRLIAKGATSQSIYVEILDSTSTTGGRKTGLVFNSAGLTGYYVRNRGLPTAITLATLVAADSAYSSGGFKEVDATNMPGIYRLDLPDAVVATGADSVVVTLKGATGMAQVSAEIQLTGLDHQVATQPVNVTQIAGAAVNTASAQLGVNVVNAAGTAWGSGAITAASLAADAITAAKVAADVGVEIAGAVWDKARAAHVAAGSFGEGVASVQGNVTGSVGSVTAGVTVTTNNDKTGYRLSAAGVDDTWAVALPGTFGAGTAGKIVGDNLNATVGSRSTLDAAGVRTAVGLAAANLDTQLDALPTAVENADALLGRNVAGGSSTGRLVKEALYFLRNKWTIAGGTLTVTATDDVTTSWTATVTQTAGNPVSAVDPA